ncbi:MAG: hypothetical protein QOI54_3651 [Actinomycetota bacterium]|jgi:hypothetical protein|nr:hypothetical protein [Actinomycetota bacterium]
MSISTRVGLTGMAGRVARSYGRGDGALSGYAGAISVFGAATGAVTLAAWRSGRRPAPLSPYELSCLCVATHKVSRLVAKDAVTSPLRAPFTRFEGATGDAELAEEVNGRGPRKALGELLTCPFCLAPWVATTFMAGYTFLPGLTRAAVAVLTAVAGADFLQLAYAGAQQRTTPPEQRDA